MSDICQLLFVYGTLRRHSSHAMARLLAHCARFVGEGRVAGHLFHLGRYPGMVMADQAGAWVIGDIYDLQNDADLLAVLDRYENDESPLPAYFDRKLTIVSREHVEFMAWVYWFTGPLPVDARHIESGIFPVGNDL